MFNRAVDSAFNYDTLSFLFLLLSGDLYILLHLSLSIIFTIDSGTSCSPMINGRICNSYILPIFTLPFTLLNPSDIYI